MTIFLYGRFCIALLAISTLGACTSSFLPKQRPPPTLYTLDDASFDSSTTEPTPDASAPSLIVSTPTAAAGYGTSRIAYVQRSHEIAYFALNQWVDTPSHMLTPLMVHAIERTGVFRAVLSAPTTASTRLRLDTELVRLQQDFSLAPSQVQLTLRAVVIDTKTRNIIARREFNARVEASSADPYAGINAAQIATTQVLSELAKFCAETARESRADP